MLYEMLHKPRKTPPQQVFFLFFFLLFPWGVDLLTTLKVDVRANPEQPVLNARRLLVADMLATSKGWCLEGLHR